MITMIVMTMIHRKRLNINNIFVTIILNHKVEKEGEGAVSVSVTTLVTFFLNLMIEDDSGEYIIYI